MLPYNKVLCNISTNFTSRTVGTWKLTGRLTPADIVVVFLSAIYTGGDTDTVIGTILETSADGAVWHTVKASSLVPTTKAAESGDATIRILPYVRVRLTFAGTAPSTCSVKVSLGSSNKLTYTAQ